MLRSGGDTEPKEELRAGPGLGPGSLAGASGAGLNPGHHCKDLNVLKLLVPREEAELSLFLEPGEM